MNLAPVRALMHTPLACVGSLLQFATPSHPPPCFYLCRCSASRCQACSSTAAATAPLHVRRCAKRVVIPTPLRPPPPPSPVVVQVGAKLVPVQLQPPNWSIPEDQLRAAFTEKTKFVLVNTPHNPTGKVRILQCSTVHCSVMQYRT